MSKVRIKNLPDLEQARKRIRKPEFIYGNLEFSNFLFNTFTNKNYFIKTFGCQANVRDEETMAGMLDNLGMIKTENVKEASIIIINTCAVRENAEDKVYGEIGHLKALKQKNKDILIAVCGCMVSQKHVVEKLINVYQQVDLVFGTHDIGNLYELLNETLVSKKRIIDSKSDSGDIYEISCSHRQDKFSAYVNIMYGCNKFCTYCIVPYTRGKERSRKKEDILKEIEELVSNGYQEITLLGQNVNSYGKDLYEDYNFANLLEDAAKSNIPRLRFTTSHPYDFEDEMIDVIAKYDNIMKFIHLPVQAGDDEVLRLMNRKYTIEKYTDLVDRMKRKIPNLTLSTDIIVGFPNETYEQFLKTIELVKKVEYDSAYTFIYSPRLGTPAAKIEDNVSDKEKGVRFRQLTKALEEVIEPKADAMVGKTYKVLVKSVSKKNSEVLTGYTEENKVVNFKGSNDLIGKIINVKIVASHTFSLTGEIVE